MTQAGRWFKQHRILQIMPAPDGLVCRWNEGDGTIYQEKPIGLALVERWESLEFDHHMPDEQSREIYRMVEPLCVGDGYIDAYEHCEVVNLSANGRSYDASAFNKGDRELVRLVDGSTAWADEVTDKSTILDRRTIKRTSTEEAK